MKNTELMTKIVLRTATKEDFYSYSRKFSDIEILLQMSDLSSALRDFGLYADQNSLNPDYETQYIDINTIKGSIQIYTVEEGINNSYTVNEMNV